MQEDTKRRKVTLVSIGVFITLTMIVVVDVIGNITPKNSTTVETENDIEADSVLKKALQDLLQETDNLAEQLKTFENGSMPSKQDAEFLVNVSGRNSYSNVCNGVHELIVMCISQNSTKRDMIRKTWGKQKSLLTSNGLSQFNMKVIFVVQHPEPQMRITEFHNELLTNQDMIIVKKINETYSDSVTLMAGLSWINSNCVYDSLLKITDSMFLNLPAVYSFMHDNKTPKTELYGGYVIYGKPVKTEGINTFRVSYPRYMDGGAFIMTFDIVTKVVPLFNWKSLLTHTDAYIGTLVLKSGTDVWPISNFLAHIKDVCDYRYVEDVLVADIANNSSNCVHTLNEKIKNYIAEI